MNLCVNARDAMPDGGQLTLKVGYANPEEQNQMAVTTSDPMVVVSVTDTGIGMDEETCSRIFEPFFTTKAKTGGTGLGLATTSTIIRNNGGHITVDSRKNEGTTFRLYLPFSKPHNQLKSTIDVDTYRAECDSWKAKGPIYVLLVDDEDLVLRSTERVLSRAGFHVRTARTAAEAIEAYRENMGEIQVVLLDLNIPESKGETIYGKLRDIDENINVLVFSGSRDERRIKHMLDEGALGFVSKPADANTLTRALWSVLSSIVV